MPGIRKGLETVAAVTIRGGGDWNDAFGSGLWNCAGPV
jgi:hypothetical protein